MSCLLCRSGLALPVLFLLGCQTTPRSAAPTDGLMTVTIREDFDLGEPGEAWVFRTPSLWRVGLESERHFLQMAVPPERPMLPGVRRPQEYAIYNKYEFRSFNLSCRVRVDRDPAIKARDACIIFCRRDDTHLYYAHLSGLSEGTHNNLVRVDGENRQILVPDNRKLPPSMPDTAWHKVDVLRNADTGVIQVFVDAYDQPAVPLFSVTDRTYEWGKIAFGSFDDHASFTRIIIEGQARTAPPDPDARPNVTGRSADATPRAIP